MHEVFNGLLYLNRNACTWLSLPHDFPPWGTVHYYDRRFRRDGSWTRIHDRLREKTRIATNKKPTPSTAIIDRQSVKTTEKRGPVAATTRVRKSTDVSGTSSLIHWG
jgi:putative transposase